MKDFLRSIGLLKLKEIPEVVRYKASDYEMPRDYQVSLAHRDFLKALEDQEDSRLAAVETKTSQMVSQTGIIFSLLSLFIPILIDKLTGLNIYVKISLLILLAITFLLYVITIQNALKNYKVNNFRYPSPSPQNVIFKTNHNLNNFYTEEVKDLLYCINVNHNLNNKKATNLLHAYASFKYANMLTSCLVILFCISIFFFNPKKDSISIDNEIKIQHFDSLMNKIIEAPCCKDTVFMGENN
jgi:hypothetical protein